MCGTCSVCLLQELQAQLEEEARVQEELREEQVLLERRCTLLVTEGEESRAALEAAERVRKSLETELHETTEKYNTLDSQVLIHTTLQHTRLIMTFIKNLIISHSPYQVMSKFHVTESFQNLYFFSMDPLQYIYKLSVRNEQGQS